MATFGITISGKRIHTGKPSRNPLLAADVYISADPENGVADGLNSSLASASTRGVPIGDDAVLFCTSFTHSNRDGSSYSGNSYRLFVREGSDAQREIEKQIAEARAAYDEAVGLCMAPLRSHYNELELLRRSDVLH